MQDLAQVEPAVVDAQQGKSFSAWLHLLSLLVSCYPFIWYFLLLFCLHFLAVQSIKKQNLVEVKSMSNPPAIVKIALESICLLLGESTTDWKVIRSILMRDNFISTIVNFTTDDITWVSFLPPCLHNVCRCQPWKALNVSIWLKCDPWAIHRLPSKAL